MKEKVKQTKVSNEQIEKGKVYLEGIKNKYSTEVIPTETLEKSLNNIYKIHGMSALVQIEEIENLNTMSPSAKAFATMSVKMVSKGLAQASQLDFLAATAPLTMDPDKIKEHILITLAIINNALDSSANRKSVVEKIKAFLIQDGLIQNVNSYRQAVMKSVNMVAKVKEKESLV